MHSKSEYQPEPLGYKCENMRKLALTSNTHWQKPHRKKYQ